MKRIGEITPRQTAAAEAVFRTIFFQKAYNSTSIVDFDPNRLLSEKKWF